jgi:hypothetical protein
MKIQHIEGKIYIIDDLMSSEQINTFNQNLTDQIKWQTDLDSGTSVMRYDFYKRLNINSIYEQFQFTSIERENKEIEDKGDSQINSDLSHIVYYPLLSWALQEGFLLKSENIIRCKVNLQTRASESARNKFNTPHCDLGPNASEDYLTALYYVNDSDGDTYFFNEDYDYVNNINNLNNLSVLTKIPAKGGRLVIFPNNIAHAGSHPVDSDYRMVINYNFYPTRWFDFGKYEEQKIQNSNL